MITYAKLTDEQKSFIETIKIDRTVISKEHIDTVIDKLNLKEKSIKELREIRNSVVKYLGDKVDSLTDYDYKEGLQLIYNSSGITSVIDGFIYNRGGEV